MFSRIFRVISTIALLFVVCQLPVQAGEQEEVSDSSLPVTIPRISSPIEIDGVLQEAAWQTAMLLELKYETDPGENIPASLRTEVLVTHDNNNIYFAFRCYDDDPSSIRARLSDRDYIEDDDRVHVNFDTFNDERRNYFFGVNPLGIQKDGIDAQNYSTISWDAIWAAAGKITDWGYVIEIAIPFSSIQFPRSGEDQVWGLDISRIHPRSKSRRFGLVPIDRNNDSYQSQFMKIRGFGGIEPGKNLEITPTLTTVSSQTRDELPFGEFGSAESEAEAGVTAKWGVTNNLTLSGTLNPDFSQVEADARQLDINQPFALFFEEKRPFFTEGSDLFNSHEQIVYTRTMRDPDWGIKLTGKEGDNTVGAYFVRDTITNLIFPGSEGSSATSLDMRSDAAVFRFKRDFGNRYTLGAILTNRQGDDYFNRVYGIDATFRLTDVDRVNVQVMGSSTSYPGEVAASFDQPSGNFSDGMVQFYYNHFSRNWNWWAAYWDYGDNFRADLGFMPQVGFRHYRAGGEHAWIADSSGWWTYISLGNCYNRFHRQDGELLLSNYRYWLFFQGAMQSEFFFQGNRDEESSNGTLFPINRFDSEFLIQPTRALSFSSNLQFGDRIDYQHTRLGSRIRWSPGISYRLGRHVNLNYSHTFERMSVEGERLFTANISQATAIYQFNARMFFRAILQYVNYDYNVAMYTNPIDPEYKELFTQLLFSYKLNPRTVLFIGYSDNYFGNQDYGITQADRTLFVKLGYAWQL